MFKKELILAENELRELKNAVIYTICNNSSLDEAKIELLRILADKILYD